MQCQLLRRSGWRSEWPDWQANRKGRPPPQFAGDLDLATVPLDDAVHHRQSQPAALILFGGVERLETAQLNTSERDWDLRAEDTVGQYDSGWFKRNNRILAGNYGQEPAGLHPQHPSPL